MLEALIESQLISILRHTQVTGLIYLSVGRGSLLALFVCVAPGALRERVCVCVFHWGGGVKKEDGGVVQMSHRRCAPPSLRLCPSISRAESGVERVL